MKGLREYVKKHGRHFTEELAYVAAGKKWSSKEIEDAAQRRVYFNVTGSTLGDMTYLANVIYLDMGWSKSKCIDFCVKVVGDYNVGRECAFNTFVRMIDSSKFKFDLTPYV